MTGDLADFVSRLQVVLPKRWFADESPILNVLLTCIATPWVWLYGLITYVIMQSRLATATGEWLDLISFDYFGTILARKIGEPDFSYRNRIQAALLQDAATRSAVSAAVAAVTGSEPAIFEPANCMDTGSYGAMGTSLETASSGLAYGQLGGWGSLQMPLQFFVTAMRPVTPGVGMRAGYGVSSGGYSEGMISYVDLSSLPGYVTDADIEAALCSRLPITTVAWLRIT